MAVSLHLGLVTASLAYVLFSKGLLHTPAATAVSLTLAEPLTAASLGVLLLKETLDRYALLGMLLMVAGLIVLMWSTGKGRAKPAKHVKV